MRRLGHTFGVAQGQEDIVIQELDVDYPAVAPAIQAVDLIERRRRGAADAVDNLDLVFEDSDWRTILSTEPSLTASLGKTYYQMGSPQLPQPYT